MAEAQLLLIALALLVLGVLANDAYDASATNNLALCTDAFDGGTDLHGGLDSMPSGERAI
jgi:hypothetical protein